MSATVQIKRKRDQDPLSALMVRSSKRSRGDLVFRLAGTYDEALPDNFILQESGDRVFKRIKSESKKADRKSSDAGPSLPPEITEMLNEYVKAHPATIDAETEDYVYDIYYGERGSEPDSTASTTSVGYIVLDEDDELKLLHDELGDSSDQFGDTADEDSNAEDFYRNDYPDEESDLADEFDNLDISSDEFCDSYSD